MEMYAREFSSERGSSIIFKFLNYVYGLCIIININRQQILNSNLENAQLNLISLKKCRYKIIACKQNNGGSIS